MLSVNFRNSARSKLKTSTKPILKQQTFSEIHSLDHIDINDLKEVNDKYGHRYGDALIIDVVQSIYSNIRENDYVVRLGGDEFLIVFNGISSDVAEKIWQRIVQHFNHINVDGSRPYIINVSHGVVEFDHNSSTTIDEVINEADNKMYNEKKMMKTGLKVTFENRGIISTAN